MRKLTAYMFADGQEKEAHAIEDKFVRDCSGSANVGPE